MAKESTIEFSDSFKKVEPVDRGYRILFEKHAGVYYLKNDSPDFDDLEKRLLSCGVGDRVQVTALSWSLHITDLIRL